MKRKFQISVPSHTTVAAYLALFGVIAGGSAYAAATIGSNDIKNDAVLSKHIKANQVKASDIAGNARSFQAVALIGRESDGGGTEFDNGFGLKERGFDSVRSEGTGSYCIVPSDNLNPAKNPPVITVEYASSSGQNYTVAWDMLTSNACLDGEYDVQTFDGETGDSTDDASFVIAIP